jgi:hypothetical protein
MESSTLDRPRDGQGTCGAFHSLLS